MKEINTFERCKNCNTAHHLKKLKWVIIKTWHKTHRGEEDTDDHERWCQKCIDKIGTGEQNEKERTGTRKDRNDAE